MRDYDVKMLNSRFMENVNNRRRNFFLFLSLDMFLWNSTHGEFAYSLQSKQVGVIAKKFEKTGIHFFY